MSNTSLNTKFTYKLTVKIDNKKKYNQYIKIKKIGKGTFSNVYLAKDTILNKNVALKIMSKKFLLKKIIIRKNNKDIIKTSELENIYNEIKIHSLLYHPDIVLLYEVIDDPTNDLLILILEYCEQHEIMKWNASLMQYECNVEIFKSYLNKNKLFKEEYAKIFIKKLIEVLLYLKEINIVHRDVKPNNILINDEGKLKLSDFGTSMCLSNKKNQHLVTDSVGTINFMSPEMCKNAPFCPYKSDTWSLGILAYCFVIGKPPFYSMMEHNTLNNIISQELTIPSNISVEFKDFLLKILEKDVDKRVSLQELLIHPWLNMKSDI